MINPKIRTKVVHSDSKPQYNIVGTTLGKKYKVAVVPYVDVLLKGEAKQHADFISYCFNNSDQIHTTYCLKESKEHNGKAGRDNYQAY